MAQPLLLISQPVIDEAGSRLGHILRAAPRRLDVLPFAPGAPVSRAQSARIEAAYYSLDVWAGTIKNELSAASKIFWPLVDAAPNLNWVQVFSAGSDQARYRNALGRGVRLTTAAGVNGEPVGVTALTGLLAISRGFPRWMAAQRRHHWTPVRGGDAPRDLRGETAVIVGTGIIGTTIARSLQVLGVKTVGIRRSRAPAECFDETFPIGEFDRALPRADWLVLAGPLTAETLGLMDARRFALLRDGTGFVNVSRGEIVVEAALLDTLRSGRLRGAYIDVFVTEPLPPDSPLWDMPNVILSPHNAATSSGYMARNVDLFLRNLERYLAGATLLNEAPKGAAS
jgi:phosphoglycerate dehydrogenase-like enzyme